jgi:hypothetical protein
MEIKRCKACGEQVVFARHSVTGNIMCLDANPNAEGKFYLSPRGFLRKAKDDDPTDHRHVSHHATCPEAERFRRRK